jgi:hypothetical protein
LSFRNGDKPLRNLLLCMQPFRCRQKADSPLSFGIGKDKEFQRRA